MVWVSFLVAAGGAFGRLSVACHSPYALALTSVEPRQNQPPAGSTIQTWTKQSHRFCRGPAT